MKKYLYKFVWGMVLFFCCIFFCVRAEARTAADDTDRVYELPEAGEKADEECISAERDFFGGWRYIKVYLNQKLYVTVDLLIVAGTLIFICFIALGKE